MPKEELDVLLSVIIVSLLILILVVALIMIFRIYLKRKNKIFLEKELMSAQFEQTLLQSKLEIQEQTFSDIGQELHDSICQELSVIRLTLNTLDISSADTSKATMIDEQLGKTLASIRNLSHSLNTDYIRDTGWDELTAKLLKNLENTGHYTTHVEIDDELPFIGKEKPIILFRMIQEIVQNIVKHADATTIVVKAKNENDKVVISIQDNGKGFNPQPAAEGVGLRNLRNRAKMINADFTIDSQAGKGTLVTISINADQSE